MKPSEYVERMLAHAGVDVSSVDQTEDDEQVIITLEVPEEDIGMLIGHHGETLAAIQRMVRLVFRDIEKRIVLNINNYREKRREKIEEMVANVAERILESGGDYTFGFLPANERFLVHTILSENEAYSTLESVSQGTGRDRRLTIQIKK